MAVPPVSAPAGVRTALERASEATGADFTLLVETARRESGFNPAARAPTSSATGLFQFIDSTWLDMVRRHGAEHGLGDLASQIRVVNGRAHVADAETRRALLDLRRNPEISARMAGELAMENAATLEQRLGRAPTAGEIYAAHVMGAGGAVRLIEAAGRGAPDASAIFPREAAANPWLFRKDGVALSPQALLDRLNIAGQAVQGRSGAPAPERLERADAPSLAALIDAMFHDLARDWLLGGEDAGLQMRARNAYLRGQDT